MSIIIARSSANRSLTVMPARQSAKDVLPARPSNHSRNLRPRRVFASGETMGCLAACLCARRVRRFSRWAEIDMRTQKRMPDIVGWFAAAVLLATIGRQVYSQWREGSTKGLSRWLFIGQMTASIAFIFYSWLLQNWVFVVTNALMLATAMLGEWVLLMNRKKAAYGGGQ
jgi:MtN3 and saliva related transmembrane protein